MLVETLQRVGLLDIAKLKGFTSDGRFEEIVAALALMANMLPEFVERAVTDTHTEALLMLAKAFGISWETAKSIFTLAATKYSGSTTDVEERMTVFERLRQPIVREILDFHRKRGTFGSVRRF